MKLAMFLLSFTRHQFLTSSSCQHTCNCFYYSNLLLHYNSCTSQSVQCSALFASSFINSIWGLYSLNGNYSLSILLQSSLLYACNSLHTKNFVTFSFSINNVTYTVHMINHAIYHTILNNAKQLFINTIWDLRSSIMHSK